MRPASTCRGWNLLTRSANSHFPSGSTFESIHSGSASLTTKILHGGRYLRRSPKLVQAISPVIAVLKETLARGAAAGEFRPDADAWTATSRSWRWAIT
ncbi:hypothetical protein PQQ62_33005 [Caballeronia grimmiae]